VNNEPSNIDHGEALRTIAQLIDDARRNGAQQDASITSHGFGSHGITLRFTATPTAREIAAWQLASRAAWTVEAYTYDEDDQRVSIQTAYVSYRGVKVRISIVQPAVSVAVAA
jgi:YD repeat-containing protein